MNSSKILRGRRIYLRTTSPADVGPHYTGWLNDPAVNRFLEARFMRHTLRSTRDFVIQMRKSPTDHLLSIILKDGRRHIGNIKLGSIDRHHRAGVIGIMLGDKSCWGQGYAAEAIQTLARYAFGTLKLHRLSARLYANNVGSYKAFKKAGFTRESIERKSCRCGPGYVDAWWMALLNPGTKR